MGLHGIGFGIDGLPEDKREAVREMLDSQIKIVERGIRDMQPHLEDAKAAQAAGDLGELAESLEAIQEIDHRWGNRQRKSVEKMFERMSGMPMRELMKKFDGEGSFLRAIGIPPEGEELDGEGGELIDMTQFEDALELEPDPSGLDAGDIVRYKGGTNGRQGMVIGHPLDGKADVRWFGDDAPADPKQETLADLERVERENEIDGIREN